jgi:hypothetical protein
MISPELIEATAILERLHREDEEIATANRLRASQKQEVAREEADALAERARLAAADKTGTLVTEKHGRDQQGRATVERERDTKRLKVADARIESIRRKKALLEDAAQTPRLTATRIELELAKYPRAAFVEVDRPRLPLTKNERAIDALPRFRDATLALIEERKATEKAARTLEEVRRAAHAEIDRLADRGLPKTLRMFHGATIEWARHQLPERSGNPNLHSIPDALALVAYLLRDRIKSELDSLLKANSGAFPDAMSAVAKAERLLELEAEIDVAERIEAACVETIVAEGGTAHHSPNSSVLAVMSLRIAE